MKQRKYQRITLPSAFADVSLNNCTIVIPLTYASYICNVSMYICIFMQTCIRFKIASIIYKHVHMTNVKGEPNASKNFTKGITNNLLTPLIYYSQKNIAMWGSRLKQNSEYYGWIWPKKKVMFHQARHRVVNQWKINWALNC